MNWNGCARWRLRDLVAAAAEPRGWFRVNLLWLRSLFGLVVAAAGPVLITQLLASGCGLGTGVELTELAVGSLRA